MDMLLIGLNWQICLAFLDDVIIMSSSFDEHLDRLSQVFARFKSANLKLNAGKCPILQKEVKFLGSIVSGNGIAPDPDKIQALKDWPVPSDLKQVQSFVAFAGYYRRHIEHFTDHARPLHRLSCRDVLFTWGENEQKSFDTLRAKLMSAPVVKAPLSDGLFILDTDASDEGLGACLQQEQGPNKDVFVIAYASKSIQESERNYCTTRKELLAIVFGLKKFRPFLLGRKFLLRTDHAALTSLLKTPEPVGQQARWLDLLVEYPMDVQHRAGKQHINADALSRRPCDRSVSDKPCAQKQCPRGEPALYCPADEVDVPGCRQEVITTVRPVVERGVKSKESISEVTFDTEHTAVPHDDHLADSGQSVALGQGHVTHTSAHATRGEVEPEGEFVVPDSTDRSNVTNACRINKSTKVSAGDLNITVPISADVLCAEQEQDRVIGPILRLLKEDIDNKDWIRVTGMSKDVQQLWAQARSLNILNGILYRIYDRPDGTIWYHQLVVPTVLQTQVLRHIHGGTAQGHFGVNKTVSMVQRYGYWTGWKKDVERIVRTCEVCNRYRSGPSTKQGELQSQPSNYPMQKFHIDLTGPHPRSKNGFVYVFTGICNFTKYLIAVPIRDKTAITVARVLVKYVYLQYGAVDIQVSDNGGEFINDISREVNEVMGIQGIHITAYRASSNGVCERVHRSIHSILAKTIHANQRDWCELLPYAVYV